MHTIRISDSDRARFAAPKRIAKDWTASERVPFWFQSLFYFVFSFTRAKMRHKEQRWTTDNTTQDRTGWGGGGAAKTFYDRGKRESFWEQTTG